jgi:hypothetical protein
MPWSATRILPRSPPLRLSAAGQRVEAARRIRAHLDMEGEFFVDLGVERRSGPAVARFRHALVRGSSLSFGFFAIVRRSGFFAVRSGSSNVRISNEGEVPERHVFTGSPRYCGGVAAHPLLGRELPASAGEPVELRGGLQPDTPCSA